MGPSQGALLSQCGLVSLLESTPIRYASEDSGNELRVIHIAEPGEDLILLAEIEVETSVKSLAQFGEFWRVGEIRASLTLAPRMSPETTSSTRRFIWRPAAVPLSAIGKLLPNPCAVIAAEFTP